MESWDKRNVQFELTGEWKTRGHLINHVMMELTFALQSNRGILE